MKKFKSSLIFFAAVVFLSSIGVAAEKAVKSFKAELGGRQVIPAVRTAAKGETVFHLGDSGRYEEFWNWK